MYTAEMLAALGALRRSDPYGCAASPVEAGARDHARAPWERSGEASRRQRQSEREHPQSMEHSLSLSTDSKNLTYILHAVTIGDHDLHGFIT